MTRTARLPLVEELPGTGKTATRAHAVPLNSQYPQDDKGPSQSSREGVLDKVGSDSVPFSS